jgi:hypothetical protein
MVPHATEQLGIGVGKPESHLAYLETCATPKPALYVS